MIDLYKAYRTLIYVISGTKLIIYMIDNFLQ